LRPTKKNDLEELNNPASKDVVILSAMKNELFAYLDEANELFKKD